jgi:hypothetical protein
MQSLPDNQCAFQFRPIVLRRSLQHFSSRGVYGILNLEEVKKRMKKKKMV